MMIESTILFMFNLDQCIELAFDQLVDRENRYKVYTILEYCIHCNVKDVICASDYFDKNQLLDCKLLT